MMAILAQMRQDNLAFQTNIAAQMSSQMNAELTPILTQMDFLTQQVENVQTTLPPGVENQDIFTEGSASEMSDEAPLDGFAAVKRKKSKIKQKKTAGAAGVIHGSGFLKKDGA